MKLTQLTLNIEAVSSSLPLVSLITINYNQLAVTLDFLASTQSLSYPNYEIIVVDNHSIENPKQEICRGNFRNTRVIGSDKNLGFAGGNNLGINHANGEYIFLVNNDTELTSNIIENLLDIFDKYPDAGIVSPKFHYFFHPGIIEYAGYERVHPLTGRNKMVGCREKERGQYNRISTTHYAHGGGMMVSKKVIDEVGLMPEFYFLYYEEFDWCNSIKNQGYKVYYQPNALLYHKESMTTGKSSKLKTYYLTRNRLLFMKRNLKKFQYYIFLTYFTLITLPKNSLKYLITAEWAHLRVFYKAISWNIFNR